MLVFSHTYLPTDSVDGYSRLCAAGPGQGVAGIEIWVEHLDANAVSPVVEQPLQRVIVVLQGSGKLLLPSGPQRFQAPCTLIVPAQAEHHIVNLSSNPMQMVSVLGPLFKPLEDL